MQLVWVLTYFVLSCLVLAGAVFPSWRQALWRVVRRAGTFVQSGTERWVRQVQHQPAHWAQGVKQQVRGAQAWWRQRWMWAGLTLLVLALPVLLTLGWGLWQPRTLDGFDDFGDVRNEQLAHLLAGEQLVPPPPLPPSVFVTAEVEVVRPLLASADRRWDLMDPAFVQRVLLAFKIMRDEHGYDMALLEGYRSPERQNQLAAKGSNVTMAGAWQSYHQFGLAADCAFMRNGKLVISEKDPWAMRGYQLYGQVAEQLGLTWGGRWQMMDLGHIEWRKPGAKAAMKAAQQAGRSP